MIIKTTKQRSQIEVKTYESLEDLKFPQEFDSDFPIVSILYDWKEKQNSDPRVQAMLQRSKHSNISIFILSRDYYELLKKTLPANGNIYHVFKAKNSRDVQNLYQDKTSLDMTLNEFQLLTSTC